MTDGARVPGRVSVLILSRGRPGVLDVCLQSVAAQDHPDTEVLLLANGCAETAEHVRRHHPDVRLLSEPENLGCAPGRNVIASAATGEFLLFLDDDGEIRAADTVTRLVEALRSDERAGVVSMGLLNAVSDEPTGWRRTLGRLPYTCYHASFAGGASLHRAQAFHDAGGYSTAFPGPGEEFDLTLRLYAAGWAVVHHPVVEFHHRVEKDDEDWRRQLVDAYAHLQYVIARSYPSPWHHTASWKALLTQVVVDLRLHGGHDWSANLRRSLEWRRRGRTDRRPLSVAELERTYAAKYYRLDRWDELLRVAPGVLRRIPLLRLQRKLRDVPKLDAPGVAAEDGL